MARTIGCTNVIFPEEVRTSAAKAASTLRHLRHEWSSCPSRSCASPKSGAAGLEGRRYMRLGAGGFLRVVSQMLVALPKTALLFLLRAYKFAISPLFPASCRYVPTCSEYAIEAVDRHGIFRGSAMAIWRVLRCHPFVKGGFDPVPLNHASSEYGRASVPSGENCAGWEPWTAAPTRTTH